MSTSLVWWKSARPPKSVQHSLRMFTLSVSKRDSRKQFAYSATHAHLRSVRSTTQVLPTPNLIRRLVSTVIAPVVAGHETLGWCTYLCAWLVLHLSKPHGGIPQGWRIPPYQALSAGLFCETALLNVSRFDRQVASRRWGKARITPGVGKNLSLQACT